MYKVQIENDYYTKEIMAGLGLIVKFAPLYERRTLSLNETKIFD